MVWFVACVSHGKQLLIDENIDQLVDFKKFTMYSPVKVPELFFSFSFSFYFFLSLSFLFSPFILLFLLLFYSIFFKLG